MSVWSLWSDGYRAREDVVRDFRDVVNRAEAELERAQAHLEDALRDLALHHNDEPDRDA